MVTRLLHHRCVTRAFDTSPHPHHRECFHRFLKKIFFLSRTIRQGNSKVPSGGKWSVLVRPAIMESPPVKTAAGGGTRSFPLGYPNLRSYHLLQLLASKILSEMTSSDTIPLFYQLLLTLLISTFLLTYFTKRVKY